MVPHIVTLNAGSSSIKFSIFSVDGDFVRLWDGAVEGIDTSNAVLVISDKDGGEVMHQSVPLGSRILVTDLVLDWLRVKAQELHIVAVGHRVVHGGPRYTATTLITPEVITELQKIAPYAPKHLPDALHLIELTISTFPNTPQVACFDTAFHSDMPKVASTFPIPRRYTTAGVKRYGFHGLSYQYLIHELDLRFGNERKEGRVIMAHLGNGASVTASVHGKSVDTSMGFTPCAGIPMSTRSGDLDPGLVEYLMNTEGLDASAFHHLVNSESGLLGISETSSDMKVLLDTASTDERAEEAVAIFCYQIKKYIGAYSAVLGGVDTLLFSGGIGERSPEIRRRIVEGLDYLGITVDRGKNEANETELSPPGSRVLVAMFHTDESWTIANETNHIIAEHAHS